MATVILWVCITAWMRLPISPERTPSHSSFQNCSRASHSGNLLTGLQLCLTQGLYGLWISQCRQEHISSRVYGIWIKLEQGQAERLLRSRAYCCSGSKRKKAEIFLWRDRHFDGLFKPALSRRPLFYPRQVRKHFRSNILVLPLRWLKNSKIF